MSAEAPKLPAKIHVTDIMTLTPDQSRMLSPLVEAKKIKIIGSDTDKTEPEALNMLDLAASLSTLKAGNPSNNRMAAEDLINIATLAGIMKEIQDNQAMSGLLEYYMRKTKDPIQALANLTANIHIREQLEKSAGSLALAEAAANTARELLPREDELKQMPRVAGLMKHAARAQSELNVQQIQDNSWESTISGAAQTAGETSGKIAGVMLMTMEPAMATAATIGEIAKRHPMAFVGLLGGAALGVSSYASGVNLGDIYQEGANLKDTAEALGVIPVGLLSAAIGAVAAESLPKAIGEGGIRFILWAKETVSRLKN